MLILTEKLLSSHNVVQDRSAEEAEKGFRGKLYSLTVFCFGSSLHLYVYGRVASSAE